MWMLVINYSNVMKSMIQYCDRLEIIRLSLLIN